MKKYTNKILCITLLIIVLYIVVGITIDFQHSYHNDPEGFTSEEPEVEIIYLDEE